MIKTLLNDALSTLVPDASVIDVLENGGLIYLPQLNFAFNEAEQVLLSPNILPKKAKNISYDPRTQQLKAFDKEDEHAAALTAMMQRYATFASDVLMRLFPSYQASIARTSYRPVEVAGRTAPSFRKDDSRLHVDAFPASPNQGQQLLRVFSNVNPAGTPRMWRVGEPFTDMVKHFQAQLTLPMPWIKHVLQAVHITRGLRTPYDALMLQLHDLMKADSYYQANVQQQPLSLTGTWIVFTDQVSHAAMSGQYCLEQTFMLPVAARKNPANSPLKVLERVFGRSLV